MWHLHVKTVEQAPFKIIVGLEAYGLGTLIPEIPISSPEGETSESFSFPGQFITICPFVLGFYPPCQVKAAVAGAGTCCDSGVHQVWLGICLMVHV